jgi:hypothetical protein
MDPMIDHLQTLLVRDIKAFIKEIECFPDDETIWKTLPGITNSAANLSLHVSGNLQYFVGSILGGSGYQRDRDSEFSRRSGTKREILNELDHALGVVESVIPTLSEEVLNQGFPFEVEGKRYFTKVFLLRLSAHLAYHLGQANYLRRALVRT